MASFVVPEKPHSKSRVEQQTLPELYPQHSTLPVMLTVLIIAALFIPIGAVVIVASDRIVSVDYRYDNINNYAHRIGPAGELAVDFTLGGVTYSTGVLTRKEFTLSKSMRAPIFIQYRLKNYFQNYRWYGASIDASQLHGGDSLADNCEPFRYPGEFQGDRQAGYYTPCGTVPWSMFNDTISLYHSNGTLVCDGGAFDADGSSTNTANRCHKKGIALKSDPGKRFRPPGKVTVQAGPAWMAGGDASSSDPYLAGGYYYREPGHKIPSSMDEDLMLWTKQAAINDFTLAYRIVDVDLPAGTYYFEITEHFPVVGFKGKKHVCLTTQSWIGGHARVLGILLVTMGCVAFVVAIAAMVLQLFSIRRE